jgi:hypothetical protein
VELVQERTDIALQNTLKSTAEPLPIQGPDGTIQWQNELYLPNSSSSDSQFIQLSTPQPLWVRGMEESSHNALIGSQSRTSSENSNHTTESSTSNGSVQLPNKRKKIPTSHRHFRYQPLTLTLNEFKLRLAARLSEDVLETELMVKFPSLYAFREEYIIPLTRKFPCTKTLDLSCLVGDDDMFRKGFESSYESIFVKGCHVPRIPRAAGKTAIPETKQRIMYRHLIKDLWEILGSLFYYAYLFRYQLFNY